MSDDIYTDSIIVSAGRFTVRTNTSVGWAKGRAIVLNDTGKKPQRFGGLTDDDLTDLYTALSEYLRMKALA